MIKFEGLDDVLEALDSVVDEAKLEQALGKACALVEKSAKQNAPKDTGALARSITSEIDNLQGIVFTPLEYAPYVEYGTGLFAESSGRQDVPWSYKDEKGAWHKTSGMKPQPFMRPALDDNQSKIIEIIKEGILDD